MTRAVRTELDGAPAALHALDDARTDPDRVRRLDVVGPGGHGKTPLLDALAEVLSGHGAVVRRAPDGDPGPDAAVLVDDAHLLPEAELARVAELAAGPTGWVVVAHRPCRDRPDLAALGARLARLRAPVVLGPLDPDGVRARTALLVGPTDPELAAFVHGRTGGIPALVDQLIESFDGVLPAADWTPSAALLSRLGYALDGLPETRRRLLLALALGAPPEPAVLAPLLGLPTGAGAAADPASAVDELVHAAWAEGLLLEPGTSIPLVAAAVLERSSPAARTALRRGLAELELERADAADGGLDAARRLLELGVTGPRVAGVLTAAAGDAAAAGDPAAAELFAEAVRAGAPELEVAGRRAEAALLTGDLDAALAQADLVLSAVDGAAGGAGGGADGGAAGVSREDALRAARVAGAVLARRGNLARSAELHRWTGAEPDPESAVLAVPALVGTGALDEARAVLGAVGGARPPTLRAGAEQLTAEGVVESVTGSATAAMSMLVRAAALLPPERAALLPDTPAALAGLVALHCGELDVARSALEKAVRTGGPATQVRHRLLLGWLALHHGAHASVRATLAAHPPGRLEPRDELHAAALEVALARRANDPAALLTAWTRAREAIVHHPVDLYVLQPLAELRVAAARLGEPDWVQPHLDEAALLLRRLGDPLLWAAPLHWAAVHAAMFAGGPDAAAASAAADVEALEAGAATGRYAAAMAAGARQWWRVLAGDVDAGEVEAAARALDAVGLTWDGGRLAGQAAIRTRDRRAMTGLLALARALQQPEPASDAPEDEEPPSEGGPLSDREREVAALVLEGLTYRQIGERLFISAKTVEHHVARMRQRLGSESRGELFAHLRAVLGGS
jgi:DNA-binding CsgD family transcriptional regulator